ncbi:hypothetical protein GGI25_006183 [Coemansia spiralis]|uniref:Uncharacterized protein n=2 Tax=Coemansia TaxID=4863 RepID=A0A9W8KV20_9FUNG|nr:hypothetical protein BX070DRAFT_248641 [Coemansia spiralis]KAJ1988183.1 hypothetical protein EDC05_005448 [Coemansia umbellata]KAJ2619780.1 hypothetical protein GGI26_005542 [Coemansia sp. RSA 1358]KAJ2669331.1 hypothetical protein GGI25_006183 [Coemansia spiralis]
MFRITAAKAIRPAFTRLCKPQTAVARRFESHDSKHSESKAEKEYVFEEEGFNSPLWKYSLGAIGVLYLISIYDDHIEKSGRVHPITLFLASIMPDKVENSRMFREHEREIAKIAQFNVLQWEEKQNILNPVRDAAYQQRTAKWGTPIGTTVDVTASKDSTPVKE